MSELEGGVQCMAPLSPPHSCPILLLLLLLYTLILLSLLHCLCLGLVCRPTLQKELLVRVLILLIKNSAMDMVGNLHTLVQKGSMPHLIYPRHLQTVYWVEHKWAWLFIVMLTQGGILCLTCTVWPHLYKERRRGAALVNTDNTHSVC